MASKETDENIETGILPRFSFKSAELKNQVKKLDNTTQIVQLKPVL